MKFIRPHDPHCPYRYHGHGDFILRMVLDWPITELLRKIFTRRSTWNCALRLQGTSAPGSPSWIPGANRLSSPSAPLTAPHPFARGSLVKVDVDGSTMVGTIGDKVCGGLFEVIFVVANTHVSSVFRMHELQPVNGSQWLPDTEE
jgi:hypothetical protein